MKKNLSDCIGLIAMLVGFVAEIVGQWADSKEIDEMVSEKVAAEVAKAMKNVKVVPKK